MPCTFRSLLVAFVLTQASSAYATVPTAIGVDGALRTGSGSVVADGAYKLTFKLYKDSFGGAPLYSEGPVTAQVAQGGFHHALGATVPLEPKLFSGLPTAWLGVTVDSEPELARRPLLSTPFALRAGAAEALDCSGCVGAPQLDPAVFSALVKASELAKVAQSGQYDDLQGKPDLGGYAKLAAVKDVGLTGKYGDLEGLPVLPKIGGSCGTGLVMKGIKADGSYECTQGGITAASLPKDGLDEISNGLLTNQFTDVVASTKTPIDIPDALGVGTSDTIDVGDIGIAQSILVTMDIDNSDISNVRVTVYDPNGVAYLLYDQGGSGKVLKAIYPSPDKTVSGDLATWIGKNPKGLWSINVTDLVGTSSAKDGKLNSWSLTFGTMSSKKVAALGGFQFFAAAKHPVACSAGHLGYTYLNTTANALYICNGTEFFPLALVVPPGSTKETPAQSCKEILTKSPLAKDGAYWLAPGGVLAYQAWCDMTTAGGGWTRCLAHRYMPTLPASYAKTWVSTMWNTKGSNLLSDNATGADYGNFCPQLAANATQILGRVRYPSGFGGDFETTALTLPKNLFDATSQVSATGSGNHAIVKDNGTAGQGYYGLGCTAGYTSNKMQGIHALCLSNGAKFQAQHTGWTSGQYTGSCADSSSQPCSCTQGDYCGGSNPLEKDIVISLYLR